MTQKVEETGEYHGMSVVERKNKRETSLEVHNESLATKIGDALDLTTRGLGFGFIIWAITAQIQIFAYCFLNQTSTVTIDINAFGEGATECWLVAIGAACSAYYLLAKKK